MAVSTILTVYDINDIARLTVEFRNLAGTLVDPTAVTGAVKKPDGTVDTYVVTAGEIIHDSLGTYHLDIPADQAGHWMWKLVGSGAATDTGQGEFYVRPDVTASFSTPVGLTTLERLRMHVLRSSSDESADEKLTFYGEVMSDRVAEYARREFSPTPADEDDDPVARDFAYDGSGSIDLAPYDLRKTDDLEVTLYTDRDAGLQVAADATQYQLSPRGGNKWGTYESLDLLVPNLRPLYYGFGWQITITGRWGMTSVPRTVELAVLIAVDDVMKNPGSWASQDLGGYSVQPQLLDTSFDHDARGGLPKAAIFALAPYRRRKRVGSIQLSHPVRPTRNQRL